MANPEHLKIIRLGSKSCNPWRDQRPRLRVDLRGANLRNTDLSGCDLSGADLSGADLSGADLSGADLSGADLSGADLSGADLTSADLRGADLRGADLRGADLRGASLHRANLQGARLKDAKQDDTDPHLEAPSGATRGSTSKGLPSQETGDHQEKAGLSRSFDEDGQDEDDCLGPLSYSSPGVTRGGPSRGESWSRGEEGGGSLELPCDFEVWFATNRKVHNDREPTLTNERDSRLHYGSCVVHIPQTHKIGGIGTPFWRRWPKGEFRSDRLDLRVCRHLAREEFWRGVRRELDHYSADEQAALVYLHGYNTPFEEAARRAAQLGFDLKITGVTAFFSWPSQGRLRGYLADRTTAETSEPFITQFLTEFAEQSGCPRVHVLAHSMGNYAFLRSIDKIVSDASRRSRVRFEQIFLTAPDVDVDLFQQLAPKCLDISQRTTLYASAEDQAVRWSGRLQSYPRAGFVPPITVVPDIDTIEASGVDVTRLGHGYYAASRPLLVDFHELMSHNTDPLRRQGLLRRLTSEGHPYWKFAA